MAELVGFISCSFTADTINILNERNIPYVALVDPIYAKIAKYSVLRKEHYSFPFRYLSKLGHRNICLIEYQMNSAFLSKMQNAIGAINREVGDFNVISKESFYNPMKVNEEITHIVSLPQNTRPTAILCHDDKIAAWALESLRKLKVKVPEEMSVLGVGNFEVSAFTFPKLTTISIDYESIGEKAVELFIKELNGKDVNSAIEYVNYHVIERETCCKAAV
jgi:LacI family transcriptional regulator